MDDSIREINIFPFSFSFIDIVSFRATDNNVGDGTGDSDSSCCLMGDDGKLGPNLAPVATPNREAFKTRLGIRVLF